MNRLLAMAAVGVLASLPAFADGPLHVKQMVPQEFDAAAGEFCDFAFHAEARITQNIKLFFDEAGNVVRVVRTDELWALHRNVDTGYTLTEVDHYAIHVDFTTGEVASAGQAWHLRDEDGRLVLVRAGRTVSDLVTGELLSETPNAGFGLEDNICPALGGAPAQ